MFICLGLVLSDEDKKKYALQEIEKLLRRNGDSLERFTSMPKVLESSINDSNVLILDEGSYPRESLLETPDRDVPKMTDEQRKIFDEILRAVSTGTRGTFFVCLRDHTMGQPTLTRDIKVCLWQNRRTIINWLPRAVKYASKHVL